MNVPDEAGWMLDEYDAAAFWSHVHPRADLDHLNDPLVHLTDSDGPCWEWRGATAKGYGRWEWRGSWHQAHRMSYRDANKPLAADLDVDHLCRNTSCVRPNHLDAVTERVNAQRGRNGRAHRTHCKNGHPFTTANTRIEIRGGREVRLCRSCRKAFTAAHRSRTSST